MFIWLSSWSKLKNQIESRVMQTDFPLPLFYLHVSETGNGLCNGEYLILNIWWGVENVILQIHSKEEKNHRNFLYFSFFTYDIFLFLFLFLFQSDCMFRIMCVNVLTHSGLMLIKFYCKAFHSLASSCPPLPPPFLSLSSCKEKKTFLLSSLSTSLSITRVLKKKEMSDWEICCFFPFPLLSRNGEVPIKMSAEEILFYFFIISPLPPSFPFPPFFPIWTFFYFKRILCEDICVRVQF